jgi:phosphate starvation-inducible PhoH-like protein
MLNYLLGQIGNNGHYKKLIVIPNNSSVADSKEVGLLPGDILDKEMSFLGPLIDLLGPDRLREKMEREEIEVVPIAFARGRNWDNSLVFVSESQNLTDYHIKLLLGRMGENSRIFFDGDVRQEDSRVFADNSGLVLLHKLAQTDSSKLFGSVELKSIERSMVARLADVLDDIKG